MVTLRWRKGLGDVVGRHRYGHFELLKWACENGCPRDVLTCANAAYRGDLEMLKWARDNDFPWDDYVLVRG